MTKSLLPESERLYLEFKDYRENVEGKNFDTIKASIKNFLKFIGNKPLNDLTDKDYAKFLKTMVENNNLSQNTIKSYNSYLTSFITFLQEEKGHKINFFSKRQDILNKVIENLSPRESRKDSPLSLDEWVSLRQALEEFEEYQLLFILEVIYQYNLRNSSRIKEFHALNYIDGLFHINKKTYEPSPYLKLIIDKGGMPDTPISEHVVTYRIDKIRNYTKRKQLVIGDIILTRTQNFFTCPNCLKSYENTPGNWVVFDYGRGHTQAIVCRKVCYEEVLG